MYNIEIKTPEGIYTYEKENLDEIEQIIVDHPDYEELNAKQIKEK